MCQIIDQQFKTTDAHPGIHTGNLDQHLGAFSEGLTVDGHTNFDGWCISRGGLFLSGSITAEITRQRRQGQDDQHHD